MKHAFKKSLLAATLCVVGIGMTYSASSSAGMVFKYEEAYAANPDNPTIPAPSSSNTDGPQAFTDPAPALPPETGASQDIDNEPGENEPQINAQGRVCNTPNGDEEQGSAMTGESMVGKIKVVFQYEDIGNSDDIDWEAGPPGTDTGFATDGIWELSHKGDTFEKPWRLKLVSDVLAPQDPKLIGVVIKTSIFEDGEYEFIGNPIATVFDIYYDFEMTPGSGRGRPFEVTAYPDDIARPQGEYSVPVLLNDGWYGDWFSWLTISIPGGWDGSEGNSEELFVDFVLFLADTDCILSIDVANLEASANMGSVQLTWDDETPSRGLGSYVVFRTTDTYEDLTMFNANTTEYMDNTVEAGKSYLYTVLEREPSDTDETLLKDLRRKYDAGELEIVGVAR